MNDWRRMHLVSEHGLYWTVHSQVLCLIFMLLMWRFKCGNVKYLLGPKKISIWKQLCLKCLPSLASLCASFPTTFFFYIPFSKWKLSRGVKVKKLWLSRPSARAAVQWLTCAVLLSCCLIMCPIHSITGQRLQKKRGRTCFSSATHALPRHPALVSVCLLLFLVSHKINFFCSCHSLETLLLLSLSRRGKRQREKRGQ